MSAPPTVIYLAGSGRSGSTLLERTLGQMHGFVNVGELIDLFRRVAPQGERCGCGEPFASCPFWTKVGEQAFGGWDAGLIERVRRLQGQVARQRHLPRLLAFGRAETAFRDATADYGAAYESLYRAIAATAGARYVVDASKWPVQALALARAGLDVRVMHLVRDARGVAHSLGKQAVSRPHAVADPEMMWHQPPASSAARWVACQTEAGLLPRCGLTVTRLRYEDFVTNPRGVTRAALAALRIAAEESSLAHIAAGSVTLGSSHGLSGNPSRFRAGEITLRADEEWRAHMPRRDRAVVTAIAAPHLLWYGRRRTGRRGPANVPHGVDRASAAVAPGDVAPLITGGGQASPATPAPRQADRATAGVSDLRPTTRRAEGAAGRRRHTTLTATEAAQAASTAGGRGHDGADPGRWPLVSVIVPTHERPGLVRESIASVVAQDYPGDVECIVVHDREPVDSSLARASRPGRSVTVTANRRTPGLAGARNTGLGVASGEFIAGCDDDDVWHPGKLRLQMTRLLADPTLLAVGSGMRLLLPSGKVIDRPGRADVISYRLLLRNRVKELHSSTLVMRRAAIERAGQYDEELPGGYAEDYDWVLRVARAGRIGTVAPLLADVRKDAGSWYYGRAGMTAAGLEHLLAKHPDIAGSRRGHARMLGQIALARSVLGERRRALHAAAKAFARWPLSLHAWVALAHIVTGIDDRHLRRAARLLRRGMA